MAIVGPGTCPMKPFFPHVSIGSTLVSRPHLYSTVSIVCGLAAYILKRIALREDMPSMRKHVKFNDMLDVLPGKDDTLEDCVKKCLKN